MVSLLNIYEMAHVYCMILKCASLKLQVTDNTELRTWNQNYIQTKLEDWNRTNIVVNRDFGSVSSCSQFRSNHNPKRYCGTPEQNVTI